MRGISVYCLICYTITERINGRGLYSPCRVRYTGKDRGGYTVNEEKKHIIQTVLLAIGVVVVPYILTKAVIYIMKLIG